MGHGHQDQYSIPDYKIYKVEDVPKLMETRRALDAHGLKDPWLRNEVWRYNVKEFGNEGIRLRRTFFTGFRVGFAAFVVTVIGTALYDRMKPSNHGHEHH